MNIKSTGKWLFAFSMLFTFLVFSVAKAQSTSDESARLQKWLERFPQADTNSDGILTLEEARKFRDQLQKSRTEKAVAAFAPNHRNMVYGPDVRNQLDLWLAESKEPTPLIMYIHGGGFVAGSKEKVSPEFVREALKRGFSVASINYRFVTQAMFPAPQHDGARAVQFLKHHAEKYNLNPDQFAVFGGSAGAGISMWIGYHDDLANSSEKDPILRESSRVAAVGSIGGQSSYDPFVIREWIGGQAHAHPSIYLCYRVVSLQQLANPQLQPLYDEVSAIKHVTRDDPPTFMFYGEADEPLPPNAKPGQGIHHPIFGHKLKEKLDEAGIKSEYRHVSTDGRDMVTPLLDFFEEQFLTVEQ